MWNWQKQDWPDFRWDASRFLQAERRFLVSGGLMVGSVDHLKGTERDQITVELMSAEALTTSEIEGEMLDRASVQSSITHQLGLATDHRRVQPREWGIAEMTVNAYQNFADPLTDVTLFAWHAMLMNGRTDLGDIGHYRTHAEPMQVVSGWLQKPKVHFEAPPSAFVPPEMRRFIAWFNESEKTLPALTRAGIAHLYFVSVHPFEDGNGRIGRAAAEKALLQGVGRPMLLALSPTVLARRKSYYEALEAANKSNEVTEWLTWFGGIILEAQRRTLAQVEFLLDKARLLDGLRGTLNARQEKALLRMLEEGPSGLTGGLSASKYTSITGATSATATRDLGVLVEKGALVATGELKGRRYHLNVPMRPTPRVTINERGEVVEAQ